ncbi:MAG: hypothetical protein P1U34_00655 [Coxiellaceae bacterium]|nr:hypothetical protein [Coxiellaceae bacterium]
MKSILFVLGLCLFAPSFAAQPILGPVTPDSHAANAGIIIFQDLDSRINGTVTMTSASLEYFEGTKNGDYCSTPNLHTHLLKGQYTFTLRNGLFAYQLNPTPIYKSFLPPDGTPITDVHCLEFIIQSGDHTFTPQVVAFNIDCSQNQQCIATSAAETVVVS